MIRGQFLATDNLDLAFNRILNWNTLEDLPSGDASSGEVLVWSGSQWAPGTVSASGVVSVTWGDVGEKPTFVNELTAGDGISVSSATGDITIADSYHTDTNEPTGFVDPDDSVISITDNKTFSIEPASSQFEYYDQGVKYTVTSTDSITFAGTEGLKAFYYEGATLSVVNTFDPDQLIGKSALVAITYWDATNNVTLGLGEERHGITMDGMTHRWMHQHVGTIYIGGHALGDIVTDGDGSASTHASLSVASGTIADEDLYMDATAKTNPANIPVMYLSGTGTKWRKDTARDWPVKNAAAGNGYLAWNENDGSSWVQTEVTANRYVLAHIIRTNATSSDTYYIAVQGQATYLTLGLAQDGAAAELNALVTAGLPMPEFMPLGSVIFQTGNFANTPKARIRPTEAGDDYVDWRFQSLSPASPAGDHGALSGLTDPDHPLTALQQSSATTNQAVVWNGSTWVADAVVNSVVAGTGISLSGSSGDVTVTCDLTWTELANKPTFVNDVTAGSNININNTTGSVAVSCITNPTFEGVVTCDKTVFVNAGAGTSISTIDLGNGAAQFEFHNVLFSEKWVFDGGEVEVSGGDIIAVTGSIRSKGSIFLGYGRSTNAIQTFYFYHDGSGFAKQMRWHHTNEQFEFNDDLLVEGTIHENSASLVTIYSTLAHTHSAAVDSVAAGTNIAVTTTTGDVTVSCITNPTFAGDVLCSEKLTVTSTLVVNHSINAIGHPITAQYLYVRAGTGDNAKLYYKTYNNTIRFQLYMADSAENLLRLAASTNGSVWDYDLTVWDNVNSRVGIGTATPAATLDVNGTARANTLISDGNIYLNYGGPDGDSFVYFYADSSATGKHLKWDEAFDRFEFDDTISVSGDVKATGDVRADGSVLSDVNLYINYDGPNGDSYIYFYAATSAQGAYIYWDDSDDRFVVSHDVRVSGNVYADGPVYNNGDYYVNYGGGDGDSFIYFYADSSVTGKHLKWDEANTRFEFDDTLSISGTMISETASIAGTIIIGGDIDHNGSNIGFYGTAPIAKPTVTGSRSGNAALASLLTELANLGLIVDDST